MDIFIGGGGDDLPFLNLGVLANYAQRYAAQTLRPVLYVPNARIRRVREAIEAAAQNDDAINLIGHSWGGPDAWRSAAWALRKGFPIRSLITLDPVSGPLRSRFEDFAPAPWLNVLAEPTRVDRSDRMTTLWPWARKPSQLPVAWAMRQVRLDTNHWNVAAMMAFSGARAWLDADPS